MSYDEKLAQRARRLLKRRAGSSERKMFGGLCFMLDGNMCGGVLADELIVRVLPDEYDAMLKRPYTRVFDFTGRPMKGFRRGRAARLPHRGGAQILDRLRARGARGRSPPGR